MMHMELPDRRALRNYSKGIPVLVSGTGTAALMISANEFASFDYNERAMEDLQRRVEFDEVPFYREASKETMAWIRENPWRFLSVRTERLIEASDEFRFLILTMLGYTVVSFPFFNVSRYHIPLVPMMILIGALALAVGRRGSGNSEYLARRAFSLGHCVAIRSAVAVHVLDENERVECYEGAIGA
jgi:hypothetical protein